VNVKLIELKTQLRRVAMALIGATHTGFAAFGLLALAFLVFDGGRLVPIHAAQAGGIALGKMKAEAKATEVSVAATSITADDPRQRAVADHLARRFRIAAEALDGLVTEAYVAGAATGVDPLLILAVMAIESRFNPFAQSDFGAKGLMQVVPRFHLDKLAVHGGEEAVLDPRTNIHVGAQILREYVRRTGSLEEGLQLYAGAADDPAQGYAQKVVAEQRRMADVVARVPRLATNA
jgi:soluble lytic murein transglycosylase-like protein